MMNEDDSLMLVEQLAAGFDALQKEYQKLHIQHQAVEKKLATARKQYNELAKLCGSGDLTSPPLSLSSALGLNGGEISTPHTTLELLEQDHKIIDTGVVETIRTAITAASRLRLNVPRRPTTNGVTIWSGPSADRIEGVNSSMPSISESPLEQDFTIEGKPSRLGCPFASTAAKKRLSAHAASVLNKYDRPGSSRASSSHLDSASRIDGRESMARRDSRRASFFDPIKAEICGLSDHNQESPPSARVTRNDLEERENVEVGVCPIRFLDQHSPEEVATYFEKHKHELPRSHEVCVKRYQSNEEHIRQLDAKYGSLVSMIQGLGAKHKDMLPKDLEDDGETAAGPDDARSAEKVRKWASSVSAQAVDGTDHELGEVEERRSHFERPLRDVRLGESPSRPWGIQIPMKYLERVENETDGSPAEASLIPPHASAPGALKAGVDTPAQCPFGFDKTEAAPSDAQKHAATKQPVFIARAKEVPAANLPESGLEHAAGPPRMVLTGPVFIGYSAADAAKILRGGEFGLP